MGVYMQYICKNLKCGKIFLAEDVRGCITPQKWRYCNECEDAGFPKIRQDEKPKKKASKTLTRILDDIDDFI